MNFSFNTYNKSMKLSRMLSSSVETNTQLFKVLFCGHEFSSGYLYSKEAMSHMNNVITVQCSRENLHKEIINANVIIPLMCRIQQKEIDLCQNLDMIMQYGVGLEGVDISYATEKGIYVCNIPSENTGNAQSCAEHAIFLSLSLLRDTYAMNISLKSGGLGDPIGKTLYKATAIIYGYGGIGKQLKQRLLGFDMNIIIISRSIEQKLNDNNTEKERNITYIHPDEMATTPGVKEADLVYICCSQNKDNIGLVNHQFIELLKPGVLVVNVARGGLLNYSDCYNALQTGQLGGLGIDVYHTEPFPSDDNLLLHPKVIATPHIAGVTEYSYRSMAQKVYENVNNIIKKEIPLDCVNNPIKH